MDDKIRLEDLSELGRRWYEVLGRLDYTDFEADYNRQIQEDFVVTNSAGFWREGFRGREGLIIQDVWSKPDCFGVSGEMIYAIGEAGERIKALGRKDVSDKMSSVVLNEQKYEGRRIENLDLTLHDFLSEL